MAEPVAAIPLSDLPVIASVGDLVGDELLLIRTPSAPAGTQTKLIPLSVLSAYIGANFVVPSSRDIAAGPGLTGGGTLAANRTIRIDANLVADNGAIFPAILAPGSAAENSIFRNSANGNALTYKRTGGALTVLSAG